MRFPKRAPQHVSETESFKILRDCTPAEWLLREVSERDYGIDAYIEICAANGDVTGDLCSVQLKGTKKLRWKKDRDSRGMAASIRSETVNYWMGLPCPVFLVRADISTRQAYFCPVKRQVRRAYSTFLAEKPMRFSLNEVCALGTELGMALFMFEYSQEKKQAEFEATIRDPLVHFEEYKLFVQDHQYLDCFLELETPDTMTFLHLYKSFRFLAHFLGVDWRLPHVDVLYQEDARTFGGTRYQLHEGTPAKFLKPFEPIFFEVMRKASRLISETEEAFWSRRNLPLSYFCKKLDLREAR